MVPIFPFRLRILLNETDVIRAVSKITLSSTNGFGASGPYARKGLGELKSDPEQGGYLKRILKAEHEEGADP